MSFFVNLCEIQTIALVFLGRGVQNWGPPNTLPSDWMSSEKNFLVLKQPHFSINDL